MHSNIADKSSLYLCVYDALSPSVKVFFCSIHRLIHKSNDDTNSFHIFRCLLASSFHQTSASKHSVRLRKTKLKKKRIFLHVHFALPFAFFIYSFMIKLSAAVRARLLRQPNESKKKVDVTAYDLQQ